MSEYDAAWLLFGRSAIRKGMLSLFLSNPDKRYHVREVARQVGTSPGTASRELKRLENAGAIVRTREGNQVYYQAKKYGVLWEAPALVVRRTMGAREVLRRQLQGLQGIESALIYGSYASGRMRMDSDIDVLVVGKPDRDQLTDRLEAAQKEVGRAINEIVMTPDELSARRARDDAFIESVDAGRKVEVLP